MKRIGLPVLVLAGLLGVVSGTAWGEPWLSTRYAQNCAGCHAPGRKNLEAIDRRCSLSCQGCHVNPNGGGLRSMYGKWNEERWLRTFRSDALMNKKLPAPLAMQKYDKAPKGGWKSSKMKGMRKSRKKKKRWKKLPKDGFHLVEVKQVAVSEDYYDRDGIEYIMADPDEFMYQIPAGDPYRQFEFGKVDGGGDIRYLTTSYTRDGEALPIRSFLMAADFGVRWRPFYRNIHLVFESRIAGSPLPEVKLEDTLTKPKTRSLYFMVDNLPYNVFVLAGLQRPLFGNYVPDHYALPQLMTTYAMSGQTANYNLLYQAVSVGTAPNVPYLNVHLIGKDLTKGDPEDNTLGIATNVGLRFVTLGGSINYSYWNTTNDRGDGEQNTGVQMHSLSAAATLFNVIATVELVSLSRDDFPNDFREGGVWALDTYTRFWRENYITLFHSQANTTVDLQPGSTVQTKVGLKSFLFSGVEMSLLYEIREDVREDLDTGELTASESSGIQSQLHLYF